MDTNNGGKKVTKTEVSLGKPLWRIRKKAGVISSVYNSDMTIFAMIEFLAKPEIYLFIGYKINKINPKKISIESLNLRLYRETLWLILLL